MDIYVVILVLIALVVLLGFMTNGFHKGFAKELSAMISWLAAGIVILLIAGMFNGYRGKSISSFAIGLLLLLFFALIYKIIHVIMQSINLLAKLPVIHWLDAAMGLLLGLLEGFAFLYVMEYLARNFLLIG